jgi:hypothetical protein
MKNIYSAIIVLAVITLFSLDASAQRVRRITASPAGGTYRYSVRGITDGTSNTIMTGISVRNPDGQRSDSFRYQGSRVGSANGGIWKTNGVRVATGDVNGDSNRRTSTAVGAGAGSLIGGRKSRFSSHTLPASDGLLLD